MTEDDDAATAGWDAIRAACTHLYPQQEPRHYGSSLPFRFGGDPLDGISAWKRAEPIPHRHCVGFGLTDLYSKDSEDEETSGHGFELTFRLRRDPADEDPPGWAISLMQNLARYVVTSGNALRDGEWMARNGSIALDTDTQLRGLAFVADPKLPPIATPNGSVAFVQIVGLTVDEMEAGKNWQTRGVLAALLPHLPLWITDFARASLLDRPDVRDAVETGRDRDGSSMGMLFVPTVACSQQGDPSAPTTLIRIGAGQVETLLALLALLALRLPFGRDLLLLDTDDAIQFAAGEASRINAQARPPCVTLDRGGLDQLRDTLRPVSGAYRLDALPGVVWQIERTDIRDASGAVIRAIG